jgi:hypothetical protein
MPQTLFNDYLRGSGLSADCFLPLGLVMCVSVPHRILGNKIDLVLVTDI